VTTPDATPRSFRAWSRSVMPLSIAAIGASLVGTGIVALILGVAQAAISGRETGGLTSIGPWKIELPDETATLLVMAIVLITLVSVIQSLLQRFDASIVRRRLRSVISESTVLERLNQRELLAERFLMEGWTGWVSNTVQAVGYSVILAWVGGPIEWLGLAVALSISAAVALRFFRNASDASASFFIAQVQARELERRRRSPREKTTDDEVVTVMTGISDAVYRRDTEVFRLSAMVNIILSLGILAAAVLPAVFTLSETALPLFLIVLIIWRQRMMDAVTSVGLLAWTLTLWRDAGLSTTLTEENIN
jgi:hypothetical protein